MLSLSLLSYILLFFIPLHYYPSVRDRNMYLVPFLNTKPSCTVICTCLVRINKIRPNYRTHTLAEKKQFDCERKILAVQNMKSNGSNNSGAYYAFACRIHCNKRNLLQRRFYATIVYWCAK